MYRSPKKNPKTKQKEKTINKNKQLTPFPPNKAEKKPNKLTFAF